MCVMFGCFVNVSTLLRWDRDGYWSLQFSSYLSYLLLLSLIVKAKQSKAKPRPKKRFSIAGQFGVFVVFLCMFNIQDHYYIYTKLKEA